MRSFNPGLSLEIEAFVPLKHKFATETVLHKKDQYAQWYQPTNTVTFQ